MSKDTNHLEWYGTRTVTKLERPCGFCNDSFHDKCPHEITWFDKLWICGCSCNASWEPKDVVVVKKTKTDP